MLFGWLPSSLIFLFPPCVFLFLLSPGHTFLAFLPCLFVCEILLQAMIHYCQLMDYLQVDIEENKVVDFEGYTIVVYHKWT